MKGKHQNLVLTHFLSFWILFKMSQLITQALVILTPASLSSLSSFLHHLSLALLVMILQRNKTSWMCICTNTYTQIAVYLGITILCLATQLTLEQYAFELNRSTYTCIYLNKYIKCISLYHDSHNKTFCFNQLT